MIKASTIQLLRFPFSWFLMPVFWFATSFLEDIDVARAVLVFIILHVLVYPSSNGYNSYMDDDETSIGGLEKPMKPSRQLYLVTVVMDVIAILASFLVSVWFAIGLVCYILFSRLYSYRGVRLKQYPIVGYLTVVLNQGALIFILVYYGAGFGISSYFPFVGAVVALFLIGGFYPITQVYQHEADKKDGVKTISMLLGKRGTFIFCGVMYLLAFSVLGVYYNSINKLYWFLVLAAFFLPVIFYFTYWFLQVLKNDDKADFKHTMKMNWLAGTCANLAFITLTIIKHFG